MAGRPRKHTVEESLDLALEVFWRRGYEATSIQDLSKALGVGPSSLYNTFKSKEALYQRCVQRHASRKSNFMLEALAIPNATESLTTMLKEAADSYTECSIKRGCIVLSARRVDRPDSATIDAFLLAYRLETLNLMRARVEKGVEDGDFPPETDVEGLSRFLLGILQGLSAQACDGAEHPELLAMIQPAQTYLRSL